MLNFNHERWELAIGGIRMARRCYEEAFKYAMKRKTFGQLLIEHQAIRFKFAEIAGDMRRKSWAGHSTMAA